MIGGLLGNLGDFIKTPEGQGLLSAAFGGMAGARPGQPWNTAGRAGMAGLLGYQGAQENQQQSALYDLKTKEMRDKQDMQERIRQAAQNSLLSPEQVTLLNGKGPTIENTAAIGATAPQFDQQRFMSELWSIDPMQAISMQQSMAKDNPYAKVDPKDYTPESVARFSQTKNYADLMPVRKLDVVNNQAVDLYRAQPGTFFDDMDPNKPFSIRGGQVMPNVPYQGFAITKANAGAARNNIDARTINTQESEQSKTYGKAVGEIRANISNSAFKAPATMAKLDRFEELLNGVGTGNATAVQVAQFADAIGLKIDPNLGVKEAAESISRELAADLRQPGSGPMTDKDFDNFLLQVPSLSKTPEGRAQILASYRAKLARDVEIGKLSREYAKRNNGVIDDGFMDIVSDYVAKNPVVQRTSTSGRENAFPDVSAIDAELARRRGER